MRRTAAGQCHGGSFGLLMKLREAYLQPGILAASATTVRGIWHRATDAPGRLDSDSLLARVGCAHMHEMARMTAAPNQQGVCPRSGRKRTRQ